MAQAASRRVLADSPGAGLARSSSARRSPPGGVQGTPRSSARHQSGISTSREICRRDAMFVTADRDMPRACATAVAPPSARIAAGTSIPTGLTPIGSFRQSRCGVPGAAPSATSWVMAKDDAPPDLIRAVGLRLYAARLALGHQLGHDLSQDALASALHVTRGAYANWEQGSRFARVPAMLRLYELFGVPLEWVYAGHLRTVPYDLARLLEECAAQVGAPVGAPVLASSSPVERSRPGRPAARVPSKGSGRGFHEEMPAPLRREDIPISREYLEGTLERWRQQSADQSPSPSPSGKPAGDT